MLLSLALPAPHALGLRIDVDLNPGEVDQELHTLHDRIRRPGDRLHGMPAVPAGLPGLRLRYREADGEYYLYVEDAVGGCLAGYTVFNRLIEVGRRTDPYVRAPHSKYAAGYQRRGLATAIYRWGLDAGLCLMSGARQSASAHALWRKLAAHYVLGYVDLRAKTLTYLGDSVSARVQDDLHTRMILLGGGWSIASFADATGML